MCIFTNTNHSVSGTASMEKRMEMLK